MKNLFKNLMLVAVAAMAFTACSQDVNEVNNVEKVARYEFTANFADTRSGFAEKEEGATAYKSEWFGNETLKLFITDYQGYYVETTATVNTEGEFTLELENAPESFFITAVSPAESWASESSYTIPTEQTPLANSVDPKAHLLQAQAVPVSGASAHLGMNHMAAYGKMTVNGVDFDIDHVVVDLKGTFYGYDRELSYTINATNVENNTFWFATEPIDVAEFTVTAYGAGDEVVTKTVDVAAAGKTMSFSYGRVGTFSVSGLKTPAKPDTVMDSAKYYYNYNGYGDYSEWGYVVFEDEYLGTLVLNCKFPNNDLVLKTGTYSAGDYTQGFDVGYSYYNVVGDSPYKLVYPGYMYVEVDNGAYKLNFDIKNENGQTLKATYVGAIEGLQIPDQPDQPDQPEPEPGDSLEGYNTVSFVSVSNGSYMGREYSWIGDFKFDYMGAEITFTMCDFNGPMQAANKNIKEGVYTNNGNGANANTKELYNISIAGVTGNSGSTVEVSKDGTDYVFKMIMKTVNGEYKFYYKGAL